MVEYFAPGRWEPILVNEELYLLDGQHRLYVAQLLGLTFIDILVQHVPNRARESSS